MNYPAKVKMQCLVFPPTGINKRTAACSDLHYLIRPPTLVMNHSRSLSLSHGLVSALNFSSDFRCPVPPWPLWHFCLAMDLTCSHSFWHTLCSVLLSWLCDLLHLAADLNSNSGSHFPSLLPRAWSVAGESALTHYIRYYLQMIGHSNVLSVLSLETELNGEIQDC